MTSDSAFSFAVVCEAEADQRIACDLAERVLLQDVDWLEPETIDSVVRWRGYDANLKFLTWRNIYSVARDRRLRKHGAFRSSPGAYDESRARLALRLFLELDDAPDAVILVRDTDNQEERVRSLARVRESPAWTFEVVLATPHPKRECWVLAGFDPESPTESKTLQAVRRDLGFDPRTKAEQLTAEGSKGTKNAKTVLIRLVGSDRSREEACWQKTDLRTLAERGAGSRLSHYLAELSARMTALL